jgi:hypothetical protein
MDKVWDSGRRMSRSIGRGMGMETWGVDEAFLHGSGGGSRRGGSRGGGARDDDEEALRWAAIERLPTYSRMRTSILSAEAAAAAEAQADAQGKQQYREVDVRRLAVGERQGFIERVFRVAEEDNQRFLQKLRDRIDRYVRATYDRYFELSRPWRACMVLI